ncbi:hypothetical protein GCM10027590_59490 [Nocardiopsis nanhaiensis]
MATERFLDLPEPPDAGFATDNLTARGALEAIRVRCLRVPDEIGLAAFDDIPWFPHTDPPTTRVSASLSFPGADHGGLRPVPPRSGGRVRDGVEFRVSVDQQ